MPWARLGQDEPPLPLEAIPTLTHEALAEIGDTVRHFIPALIDRDLNTLPRDFRNRLEASH